MYVRHRTSNVVRSGNEMIVKNTNISIKWVAVPCTSVRVGVEVCIEAVLLKALKKI